MPRSPLFAQQRTLASEATRRCRASLRGLALFDALRRPQRIRLELAETGIEQGLEQPRRAVEGWRSLRIGRPGPSEGVSLCEGRATALIENI